MDNDSCRFCKKLSDERRKDEERISKSLLKEFSTRSAGYEVALLGTISGSTRDGTKIIEKTIRGSFPIKHCPLCGKAIEP